MTLEEPVGARRRPTLSRVLVALVVVLAAVVTLVLSRPHHTPRAFYLVIGGSSSRGNEPTGQPGKNGRPTSDTATRRGYANDVVALARPSLELTLHEIGCPGETTSSMLTSGDACYHLPNTQLSLATAYLRAHRALRGLVSIDIGFNDVRPCLAQEGLRQACVDRGLAAVTSNLPVIVARLQRAAGPNVALVGFLYDDPFLARSLRGGSDVRLAAQTLRVIDRLNQVIAGIYTAAGVATTDQPTLFAMASTTPTRISEGRTVPRNVAMVCRYTWMCLQPPWGPDDHPNDAGYLAIARDLTRVALSRLHLG